MTAQVDRGDPTAPVRQTSIPETPAGYVDAAYARLDARLAYLEGYLACLIARTAPAEDDQ